MVDKEVMAWPNGKVSAKEILGMEPDELKQKLEGAASKDDLNAIRTQNEENRNLLISLQQSLAKLTAPPPPDPDPNIVADKNDPVTQVLTDPAGFVSRQTAGVEQTALQARADVLEMRARQKYAGAFQQFGDALTAAAQRFPVSARANEGFWDAHIRQVVGDQVIQGKVEAGSYPSLMGGSSFAPTPGGEASDPNKGFSPDVAAWFKEHNIPLDKAAKINELMAKNGEPITLENYKGKVANA